MKIPAACLALFLVAAAAVRAADSTAAAPKPELRGVMDVGTGQRFLLASGGGTNSAWEKVGDSFGSWTVAAYRAADRTLVLKGEDGKELDLALNASPAAAADVKATLADAEALLRKMNFARMVQALIEQQKKTMLAMSQRMAASPALKDADPQALAAFQQKVMDMAMSALDPKQMEADTAAIYSDVFTKEQIDGLSDFYDSPSGRAFMDKQPEIQARMQQLMVPRIMAMVPKIQAMGRDFALQQRAAAAARAAGGEAAAPAPAAP